MKKLILTVLVISLVLSSFVACKKDCKHEYGKVESAVYICVKGDCETPYVYYESCIKCGLRGTATFTSTAMRGHDWVLTSVSDETLVAPATCTSAALHKKTCRICGALSSESEAGRYGSALGHDWQEIPSEETLIGEPDCTHGYEYSSTCSHGCGVKGPSFYLGAKAPHADTHEKNDDGICVENGVECNVCDDMCDGCGMALKDYEGVDTENKTDPDPFN